MSDYTSTDVSRDCQVSLRQLQWWDEQNVLRPVHDGHKRLYSEADLRLARVISTMRNIGISLQTIRGALPQLRRVVNQQGSLPRYVMGAEYNGEIELHFLNFSVEVVESLLELQRQAKRVFLVRMRTESNGISAAKNGRV